MEMILLVTVATDQFYALLVKNRQCSLLQSLCVRSSSAERDTPFMPVVRPRVLQVSRLNYAECPPRIIKTSKRFRDYEIM